MEKKIIYILIILFSSWIIWKQITISKLRNQIQELKLEKDISKGIIFEYEKKRIEVDSKIDSLIKVNTQTKTLIESVRALRDSTYIGEWKLDSTNYNNILNQIRNENSN